MSDRVFVDANILVHMFDDDAPTKKAQAMRVNNAQKMTHSTCWK